MKNISEEEIEKFTLFHKEIFKEREFLEKIKDIFNMQYEEKFQDILILQKNRFFELVEKGVLSIFKNIYSEKIISNKKFNSLFQMARKDLEFKYNNIVEDISSEWDYFNDLKNNYDINNEEIINAYYITDFSRHCHNHEGIALHKCGHAEKGKFIKISIRYNFRFRNIKELKYLICEECKKVFPKELFQSYCSFCKENYISNTLGKNENKECFLAAYTTPHCDSFFSEAILCKLCKEKLYLFINEKKLKCLKCSYIIDLNYKKEFQWQCPECNKYFKSNVKILNSSEKLIRQNIIKKALLFKIKAHPNFMNCCDIDINNTSFFHKNECNGILYSCNIENYSLKNKKWVIVCDKCQTINNYKNFIWTCPICGMRKKELDNGHEEILSQSRIKNSESKNNIINDNEENDSKSNLNRKYLSNYIINKPFFSLYLNNNMINKNKRKNIDSTIIYKKNGDNERENKTEFKSEKQRKMIKVNINEKVNDIKDSFIRFYRRDRKVNSQRNNAINYDTHHPNYSDNNSINSLNRFKKSREKFKNKLKLNMIMNENTNDNKKRDKYIHLPGIYYMKNRNSFINNTTTQNEEKIKIENNRRILREHYNKSSCNLKEKVENEKENYEKNYLTQNNIEDSQKKKIPRKRIIFFNLKNKNNIPEKLRLIDEKNNNNNRIKQSSKKSLGKEIASKLNQECDKNEETIKKRKYILYSIQDSNWNKDGRISKETTANSKASIESSSKEGSNNTNKGLKKLYNMNNNSKSKELLYNSSSFKFRNRKKYYINGKEIKIQENKAENNISNQVLSNRFKKSITNVELGKYEFNSYEVNNKKKTNNKPSDIKEPSEINYSEDIEIIDSKIKKNKELYNKIQNGIKKILEKGRLPQFNIDNYTIGKKIGDGAFGVLFSATNIKTKKKYALKKLTASDLNLLEDFQREFEIVYKSNHDNILNIYGICVRVYDATTFSLFVLMDLGERDWEIEINRRFKEKKYYTEEELISILKQLTSALVYLQKKEIAHRDIKPENIILFYESHNKVTYKICDFGEAKEKIKINSRHKSIRGTDYYMSPILFKGLTKEEKFVRDNPYKSDVFSLGFCLIIACVLDFNFINKIRNVEEQTKLDRIIRENLESRYSFKFISVLLKMIVHNEKERIDFLGLEKIINEEL